MTKSDLKALELSLQLTLADPYRAKQVEAMLQERDRIRVAEHCSFARQVETLKLQPWQSPPVWIDDPDEVLADTSAEDHERAAARLLKKMLALGISKFHPDPLAAIDAACEKIRRRNRRRR